MQREDGPPLVIVSGPECPRIVVRTDDGYRPGVGAILAFAA
jgi:hypothetical protein